MNQMVALIQVLGLSLAVVASGWAAEANTEQAKAVAEIERLGGTVTVDEKSQAVIGVSLRKTKVTDAGLVHLKGLTGLEELDLGKTEVTDVGLKHLKGLNNLQWLGLAGTKVTDAGLKHLQGLTKLQWVGLAGTKVTDAGLEHLKRLTKLQSLYLGDTRVTNEGVKKFQQALPTCYVFR
jgi:repressor of nif and glnA expression